MIKNLLFACLVVLAASACHNDSSSTVGTYDSNEASAPAEIKSGHMSTTVDTTRMAEETDSTVVDTTHSPE